MSCLVLGCPNGNPLTADPNACYFGFPKKSSQAQDWISACSIQESHIRISEAKICSNHFDDHSYTYMLENVNNLNCIVKILKQDAVPTVNMPTAQDETVALITAPPVGETIIVVDKYKDVRSYDDLKELQTCNESMTKQISSIERKLSSSNVALARYEEKYQEASAALASLKKQYRGTVLQRLVSPKYPTNRRPATPIDRILLSKVFSEAQIRILEGRTKCRWTHDDMAVGYTIRHLSNVKCYQYLTDKLKIPLPGLSSIGHWLNSGVPRKAKNRSDCSASAAKHGTL